MHWAHYVSLFCAIAFSTPGFGQEENTDSIPPPGAKLNLSGSIQFNGGIFRSSRNPGRMPDSYYRISGNPTVKYGDWKIPVKFQYGNFEDRLLQPFNKLSISPSYKWITLHLGFLQPDFAPYIFQNHLIVGGGIELNPGKFRFAALYGELKRATDGGLLSLNDRYTRPVFKRMGLTSRIGYGTSDNFIDLVFLKGWEDSDRANLLTDSMRIYPEENLCFGLNTEQRFAKKWYFKATGAFSAYTYDSRSPISNSTNNSSFYGSNLLDGIYQPRISSEYSGTVLGSLEYRADLWRAEATYTLVQPDYASMGVYSVQSDLQRFGLQWRGNLFKKRLMTQIGWKRENNNVLNTRDATTSRNFLNGRFLWNQSKKWILSGGASYFATQREANNPELGGSGFDQSTVEANLGYNRRRIDGTNFWNVNLSAMQRKDNLNRTTPFQSLNLRTDISFVLDKNKSWTLNPAVNIASFKIIQTLNSIRLYPTIALKYRKRKSNFTAEVSGGPTILINTSPDNSFIWRTNASASYRIKRKHFFSFRLNQSSSTGYTTYSEWQAALSYRILL